MEVTEYIAKKVGLLVDDKQGILGEDLEKLSTDEFDEACQEHVVFARISPDTKHRIIKSLQKKYEVTCWPENIF